MRKKHLTKEIENQISLKVVLHDSRQDADKACEER